MSENKLTEEASASELAQAATLYELMRRYINLITGGESLERLGRAIANDTAFRLSANCSLVLLIDAANNCYQPIGSFGLPHNQHTLSLSAVDSTIGRLLKVGTISSINSSALKDDPDLSFLLEYGIHSLQCVNLENKDERIGAIIIGFQEEHVDFEQESILFEEIAKLASIAIEQGLSTQRLASYASQLESLVQERTADLAIQMVRAEEANTAKSRFVANISHELRTPLTAIIGYTSVIKDGIYGPVTEKQRDALNSIKRSSELLKELIDDVLNLSRIEAGKEHAEPSAIDLPALLQQIFKLVYQTAAAKNIKLSPPEVSPELATAQLWIDSRHIRQILINILSNAIKYTPAGGTVHIQTETIGDKAKISIVDNGVGISESLAKRLFTRFERGDDQYSTTQQGSGLGLALTKHLVELNGGSIGALNNPEGGSTFWITIPLAKVAAINDFSVEADSSPNAIALTRLQGINVLILEDNLATCELLDTLIATCGGQALIARNVKEAKHIAISTSIDVALVDIALPGENGYDFISFVRKECQKPLEAIPIIVVSACVFESDKEKALANGASLFIAKPFDPQELVQAIRNQTTNFALSWNTESKEM